MSIWADWLCTASLLRIGTAWELISWSRPLPHGTCSTSDLVIFLSLTVICTCTGPNCVCTVSPAYVFDAELEEPEPDPDPDPDEPEVPVDEVPDEPLSV